MTRLLGKPGALLGIVIFLVTFVGRENSDEVRATCSALNVHQQTATLGGPTEIRFYFVGEFEDNQIAVYKTDATDVPVKISDCYFQAGKRQCEVKDGYSFNLTSTKERTDGVLVIERVTKQSEGTYVCQTLNPPKRCTTCILQVRTEKPETDRTSPLSSGVIVGSIVGAVCFLGLLVAGVFIIRRKRNIRNTSQKSVTYNPISTNPAVTV